MPARSARKSKSVATKTAELAMAVPQVAAQLQGAALAMLGKGIAPMHRKAVANAKRLARTKLR